MPISAPRNTAAANYAAPRADWVHDLDAVEPGAWNRVAGTADPFVSHEFLSALERTDCLPEHGWFPCHLTLTSENTLIAAAPLYLRSNSFGEFVFDWNWADAYERAGGEYYPKLVSAIPFSPVLGPRLLVDPLCSDPGTLRDLMIRHIIGLAESRQLSSFHCLFPVVDDARSLLEHGLLPRKTVHYCWHNHGYRDFADFLDSMKSRRRKEIQRERRHVRESGVEIERLSGSDIKDHHWETFYEFYCSTFHRRWGSPRFTLDFFRALSSTLPDRVLLILARRNRRYVAGAFAMQGQDRLYGRHWGCSEDLRFLHFELCYYQTIEHCIDLGLLRLDAGVQGEHKLNRGFEPAAAISCHWVRHQAFRAAIDDYLVRETSGVDQYVEALRRHLPFKV